MAIDIDKPDNPSRAKEASQGHNIVCIDGDAGQYNGANPSAAYAKVFLPDETIPDFPPTGAIGLQLILDHFHADEVSIPNGLRDYVVAVWVYWPLSSSSSSGGGTPTILNHATKDFTVTSVGPDTDCTVTPSTSGRGFVGYPFSQDDDLRATIVDQAMEIQRLRSQLRGNF